MEVTRSGHNGQNVHDRADVMESAREEDLVQILPLKMVAKPASNKT